MQRLITPRVPIRVLNAIPQPVAREALCPAEEKLRANDAKAKKLSFLRGWRHHMWQMAYPFGYEATRASEAVPYESGRHAAALYEQECRALGRTINGVVSYTDARRTMSAELRRMIAVERRWCAIKLKQSTAQRLTSKG
jgi:hypothetical protein